MNDIFVYNNITNDNSYWDIYVPGGYYNEMTIEEQLEAMSKIKGLTGLFVFYPVAPLPDDPDLVVKKLKNSAAP